MYLYLPASMYSTTVLQVGTLCFYQVAISLNSEAGTRMTSHQKTAGTTL